MKDRIKEQFAKLAKKNSKALVTFITAGDPDIATTTELLPLLEHAGVDIIELGMPFSDPMADGPTIQLASERALESGTTLAAILSMVKQVRSRVNIPIVLMGYANPVYSYGWEKFAKDAANAGVDGLLLVDLPPEEADELLPSAKAAGLKVIFLLTPTSDNARIAKVAKVGNGFVYYVTVSGVTGARQSVASEIEQNLALIRQKIKLPIVAGFGISTPDQAAQVASFADGVVVGSAIVKLFENHNGKQLQEKLVSLVSSLKFAITKQTT
jgi:tryptophan synthase alpha chain